MDANRIQSLVFKVCFSIVFTEFLLGIVVTACYIVIKGRSRPTLDPRALSSVYKGQPWARRYWQEFEPATRFDYRAYVGWGLVPYHGETIASDQQGFRRTFSSRCDAETYTVWMFGGSAVWGEGSPDWLTIPSQLAMEYSNSGRQVCVRNFGVRGWVSTQEVIDLALELKRAPRKPDLVVFYDGVNDVFSFYQSGEIDVHQNFDHVRDLFEQGGSLRKILENRLSLIFRVTSSEHSRLRFITDEEAKLELDTGYLKNMRIVEALAKEYGFDYAFFWQPVILAGHKELSGEEEAIRKVCLQKFPGVDLFFLKIYALVHAEPRPRLFDVSGTLDQQKGTIYIDFAHLGPEGNHLIAARIFQILHQQGR